MKRPTEKCNQPIRGIALGLGLLSLTIVSACTGTSDKSDAQSQPAVTKVVVIKPWTQDSLAPNFTATNDPPLSCLEQSRFSDRFDAVHCFRDNGDDVDPCFLGPDVDHPEKVACPVSPTEVIVGEPKGVPLHSGVAADTKAKAWLVVLGNGDACRATSSTGIDPRDNLDLAMQCHSGAFVWGQPDTSSTTWTVKTSKDETSEIVTVKIAEAYM